MGSFCSCLGGSQSKRVKLPGILFQAAKTEQARSFNNNKNLSDDNEIDEYVEFGAKS